MNNLKICQIVPYIHEEASGPSYSVPSLSLGIKNLGHKVILVTLRKKNITPNWPIDILQHTANPFFYRVGWSSLANIWFKKNLSYQWTMDASKCYTNKNCI